MQQDKFEQASNCMETENEEPLSCASTPNQSMLASPDHRNGFAKYWRAKFMQSQSLIHELNEKSLSLEEIPGLLTVEKVKPKLSKETVRCETVMCLELKLKECPSCHSIIRSVCSKAKCKTNDKKPEMIILVKAKKSAEPL